MRLLPLPLAALAALAAWPAMANIRAPLATDGGFSEHVRGAHPSAVLLRERFVARMSPVAVDAGFRHDLHARVDVEYDIENTSRQVIHLPVRFLAVGADDAKITVNGAEVDFDRIRDDKERFAANERIAQHRCGWSAGDIMGSLSRRCSGDVVEHARMLDRGHSKRTTGAEERFDSLGFAAALQPGANTVRVTYRQAVLFREGPYGYFTGVGIRGARYGFEYLLYPAETWRRADDFTFDVVVEVPDVRDRGWFGDSFLESEVQTNLPLDVVRQPHPGTKISGTLRTFPAEVLSVVVRVPS